MLTLKYKEIFLSVVRNILKVIIKEIFQLFSLQAHGIMGATVDQVSSLITEDI